MINIKKASPLATLALGIFGTLAGCSREAPRFEDYDRIDFGNIDGYTIKADPTGSVYEIRSDGFTLTHKDSQYTNKKIDNFTTYEMSDSTQIWSEEVIRAQNKLRYHMDKDVWNGKHNQEKSTK